MTEPHEHLRARHLKWIARNHQTFLTDAPRAYEELGRGMYVIMAKPDLVAPEYLTLGKLEKRLPAGSRSNRDVRRIAQMVRRYDPTRGFVVVILEPDHSIHAYGIGFRAA